MIEQSPTLQTPKKNYFTQSDLSAEVARIKHPGIEEQDFWYHLPGTGFNVRLQIDELEEDLRIGIHEGKSPLQVLEETFPKIEQNIQGFKIEYLCQGLLFPIVLDKQIIEGRPRIVAPLYNNKLLIDTVSNKERRGAVEQSVTKVEEFLLGAEPGSIAILTSPDGWSGFEGITYQDTQTYIWRIMGDGRPMGFGVRTDMNLSQNRQFLKAFGKDISNVGTLNDQIVEVVANHVLINVKPGQKPWHFEDVVDILKKIKASTFAYKGKLFDEIYEQLKDPEELWTLDQTTKNLTAQLRSFFEQKLAQGIYQRQELEIALGITVLKIAQAIRNPQLTETRHSEWMNPAQLAGGYGATLHEVQQLIGCNGGGSTSKSQIFTRSLSPRAAGNSELPESEETLCCTCPFCNTEVEAVIAKGRIYCPHCKESAPYSR